MSLHGLPNFHDPLSGDGFQIYFPYEGDRNSRELYITPSGLDVAIRQDGTPDFLIEEVRGSTSYGVLNFRIEPQYEMAQALKLARSRYPEATLKPAMFSGGYIRLWPVTEKLDISPAMLKALVEPVAITWNGFAVAQFRLRLSENATDFIKQALERAMLISAYAEMEMEGVSQRFNIKAEFNPELFLKGLKSRLSQENTGIISRRSLFELFYNHLRGSIKLPINLTGQGVAKAAPQELAEALVHWVRDRYGEFIPANQPAFNNLDTFLRLPPDSEIHSGSVLWDLSEPRLARMPLALVLHPVDQARKFVATRGLAAITRVIQIPKIQLGKVKIPIEANLPMEMTGIDALTIEAKSKASTQTVELKPPSYKGTVSMSFKPLESEYEYRCKAIVFNGGYLIVDENMPWNKGTLDMNPIIWINVNDLPALPIIIEADSDLLAQARLQCTCSWKEQGGEMERRFAIEQGSHSVTAFLPTAATDAMLLIEAHSNKNDRVITIGPRKAEKYNSVSLHSFREYGEHTIEIECSFDDETETAYVDLLPEGRTRHSSEFFSSGDSKQQWSYFADSPFEAGYRYRVRRLESTSEPPWSGLRSPLDRELIIDLKEAK